MGSASGAFAERARILEEAARRVVEGESSDEERVALAVAAAELANRAMSIHLRALMKVRETYLHEIGHPADAGSGALVTGDAEEGRRAERWAVCEVATACGVSEYVTDLNLATALTLEEKLPATARAFAAGHLDLAKTRVIAQATGCLPSSSAEEVEALVLPDAPHLPSGRLKALVSGAVAVATGADAEARARTAREERGVVIRQVTETMAELVAFLPAEDAVVVNHALHHLADLAATPGDERTSDQRRADTLVDAVVSAVGGHGAADVEASSPETTEPGRGSVRRGRKGGERPIHAVVTVPLSTVMGLTCDPGALEGHGALPAGIVKDLLQHATWQCAVVDDRHGTLLGLGRATFTPRYVPGAALVDHVTTRDQTCRFPGCSRAARTCEMDHLVPYRRGAPTDGAGSAARTDAAEGVTCSCNVGPLCPHHHRAKHEAGWSVERSTDPEHPPGSLVWTSPTGRSHLWRAPSLTPAPRFADRADECAMNRARGTEPGSAEQGGAEQGGAEQGGAESGGAESGGAEQGEETFSSRGAPPGGGPDCPGPARGGPDSPGPTRGGPDFPGPARGGPTRLGPPDDAPPF